ncbi:hypothetical protein EOL96_00185 [Candidatus Saccharibacteria bacterium]|nr:hypothetical protein [Candidatus Saccharibacteria bacterium]
MEDIERTYWVEYKEISQVQTDTARRVLGEFGTKTHIDELSAELERVRIAFINACPADKTTGQKHLAASAQD